MSPPEQQRRSDQFCGGQQIAAPEPVAPPPRRRVNYDCTSFPWWVDRPAAPDKTRLGAGAQRRSANVGGLLAALGKLAISPTLRGTSGGGAGTIYWPERLTPGQDLTRQPNRDLDTAPFRSNGRCWPPPAARPRSWRWRCRSRSALSSAPRSLSRFVQLTWPPMLNHSASSRSVTSAQPPAAGEVHNPNDD